MKCNTGLKCGGMFMTVSLFLENIAIACFIYDSSIHSHKEDGFFPIVPLSRYFNFCLDISVVQKNGLITKIRLISKYDIATWEQAVAIHILPNISRSKDNQTMKFGKLIEYNMRNIFLDKSYTKCGAKQFPDPFLKSEH